jgi:hypothetical protein
MVVKHLGKMDVTKPCNSKSFLFRTKCLNLLLYYGTTTRVQSLSFKFNWMSAVTGLHKVREYTHFVCINQLEESLV